MAECLTYGTAVARTVALQMHQSQTDLVRLPSLGRASDVHDSSGTQDVVGVPYPHIVIPHHLNRSLLSVRITIQMPSSAPGHSMCSSGFRQFCSAMEGFKDNYAISDSGLLLTVPETLVLQTRVWVTKVA